MKLYIAASSSDLVRVRHWDQIARSVAGIEVVSSWLDVVAQVGEANPRDIERARARAWALDDLTDIHRADAVWFLVPPLDQPTRGAWCELGFAQARNKKIIVCSGDVRQSIFCALGDEYERDEDAFAALCRLTTS